MSEIFSLNREFDFVRLEGLQRATGRPAHEWDVYTVKELIDNALDADEIAWSKDPAQCPSIQIQMEYTKIPDPPSQTLCVKVSNRSLFPVEQIKDIFSTQWYTSRKTFTKGLTRGALGNALKTLLGIPYVLRHRSTDDWKPALKPMSIRCGTQEFLPCYDVNPVDQTIHFVNNQQDGKPFKGTLIQVGVDHFEQERPRTLEQVKQLAEQYHLCNPHVAFHWAVEIDEQEWTVEYAADPNWQNKFCGIAPIQWYSQTTFQDLLGALYRKQYGNEKTGKLLLDTICGRFAGLEGNESIKNQKQPKIATLAEKLGKKELTKKDIEGSRSMEFYKLLCKHSPRFDSNCLGSIGRDHLCATLSHSLPIDSKILYESTTDGGDDPHIPFVIEAAIARLKDGKRQLWTAINFSPTYREPFMTRWLQAPIRPDDSVLGLSGFLDAYGLNEDTPVVLFLHLICPNFEHSEFSKTEINHLPFKQALSEILARLLQTFRQAQEEEDLRLKQTIFRMLDDILCEVGEEERFVFDQLLEKLQGRLQQDPSLAAWLETPDASSRLRMYITEYQSSNAILTHHVARPAAGMLSIPLHPDRHISVLAEHVSHDLLEEHHVNKILYVQVQELEPVVIENGWLCRMDTALLRNLPTPDRLKEALGQCVVGSSLPVLILHNADEEGQTFIEQACTWLKEQHLDVNRIVDLGLNLQNQSQDAKQPTRLVEMMPGELAAWLIVRFKALHIPLKSIPPDSEIRRDISKRFEQLLLGHLWEGVSQQLEVTHLLSTLDRQLHFTKSMRDQQLDEQLKCCLEEKKSCAESYAAVLGKVVKDFFGSFMRENGAEIRSLVQAHLSDLHKSGRQ